MRLLLKYSFIYDLDFGYGGNLFYYLLANNTNWQIANSDIWRVIQEQDFNNEISEAHNLHTWWAKKFIMIITTKQLNDCIENYYFDFKAKTCIYNASQSYFC